MWTLKNVLTKLRKNFFCDTNASELLLSHYIYLIKGEIPEITYCPLEMEFLKDKCRHKVYLYTIENSYGKEKRNFCFAHLFY